MMKKLLVLSLCVLVVGCMSNPMPETTHTFKEETKTSTRPLRARVADFIFPEVKHEYVIDPQPVVIQQPFCYKTWDKPVCTDRPQIGQEARLVGERP